MINSISLDNFQSHFKTYIEFHEGINIISGKSDSGKTSIIRALNLVLNNKPSGTGFISHGKEVSEIQMRCGSKIIKRIKGKSKNSYWIDDRELKAFGTNVPDEIIDLLNFDEVNLQKQMDTPFLLSESSGEIARFLNRIIDIDVIDTSISNIEKMRRGVTKDIKNNENELIEYEEKIKEYDYLDKLEKLLKKVKKLYKQEKRKKEKYKNLKELLESVSDIKNELKGFKKKLEVEKEIKILEKKVLELKDVKEKYKNLKSLCGDLKENEKENERYTDVVNDFKVVNKLQNEVNLLSEKSKRITGLNDLLNNITEKERRYKRVIIDLEIVKKEYKEIMPDECPICGNKIKKEKI